MAVGHLFGMILNVTSILNQVALCLVSASVRTSFSSSSGVIPLILNAFGNFRSRVDKPENGAPLLFSDLIWDSVALRHKPCPDSWARSL
jgi:hypothetical protein